MITLTDIAANKIKQHIEKRGKGQGIRIGIRTTGCSGLAYVLEFVDEPLETDKSFQTNGCVVYVDPKSEPYIKGLIMDYQKHGLNEGFEFINPNEKDRCGCGESFRI